MDLIAMDLISSMNLINEQQKLANLESDLTRAIFKTGEHTWESLKRLFSDETETLGDAIINTVPVLVFGFLTKVELDLLQETQKRRAEIRRYLDPSLPVPFLPISQPVRLRIVGGVASESRRRLPVRKVRRVKKLTY
jgi:hypothetical protein